MAPTARDARAGARHSPCTNAHVERTLDEAPRPTTLLDLIWQIASDEELSEKDLADAIVDLIEDRRVRLTGIYRGAAPESFRVPRNAA